MIDFVASTQRSRAASSNPLSLPLVVAPQPKTANCAIGIVDDQGEGSGTSSSNS